MKFSLLFLLLIIIFVSTPISAIDINPSVQDQSLFCKFTFTKFLCPKPAPGAAGVNGTPGPKGDPNFSALYFNNSNFTAYQNNATFYNQSNFTTWSNYSYFYGNTFYNISGASINESYAYLPGRAGGQNLTGGTASGNLVLAGNSANTGYVLINSNGGKTGFGMVESPAYTVDVNGSGSQTLRIKSSDHNDVILALQRGSQSDIYNDWYIEDVAGALYFLNSASGVNTYAMMYTAAGNMGLGTVSPSAMLSVTCSTSQLILDNATTHANRMQFTVDTNGGTIAQTYLGASYKPLAFQTGGVSRLIINATGGIQMPILGAGTVQSDASGNLYTASDSKLKTNIVPYTSSAAALPSPSKYNFVASSKLDTQKIYTGFIAEDVQKNYPECVYSKPDLQDVKNCIGDASNQTCTVTQIPTGTYTLSLDDRCLLAASFNKINSLETKLNSICGQQPKLCGM